MSKVVSVLGARPQFIKSAVVSKAICDCTNIEEIIVHTGQHFDANMSNIFFEELKIPRPKYNLGIGGGTHGQNTGKMLEAIEAVLLNEKPDCVVVYGDTDSTIAGALSAVKLNINVAHVEAGLRSYNRKMPEEVNRILTDHCSTWLFAPSEKSVYNLRKEGVDECRIVNSGDVMYDAVLFYEEMARRNSKILEKLGISKRNYILATIHRQENTDNIEKLRNIIDALAAISSPVVMPIHPRTKKRLDDAKIALSANIISNEPVGYLDMTMLEKNASVIVTDSGGVQKEAFFHKVPCVTLRDETEWVELLHPGVNCLVGDNIEKIVAAISDNRDFCDIIHNPYGDGKSSIKIAKFLAERICCS